MSNLNNCDKALNDIIEAYGISGRLLEIPRISSGHINDTFVLKVEDKGQVKKFILQIVNTKVFKDTDGLINNIVMVTNHLRQEIAKDGLGERYETLEFLPTKCGKYYFVTDDNVTFRLYRFVDNSVCYQYPETAELFKQSAVAFGRFQKYLRDFPTEKIVDVIPDFHNTRARYDFFKKSIENCNIKRAKAAKEYINFVGDRESYVDVVVDLLGSDELPVRITHNDTKINNVLFDKDTNKAVCVIDLDTIMKGSLLYDFGDSIRFGCNTAAEDEKDLDKVLFDMDKFKAYTEGYLSELGDVITNKELELLAFSAILLTFECGMRFLNDYILDDVYFKTAYEEHNLVRAKNQFKLVTEMEAQLDDMNAAVFKIAKEQRA